MNWATFITVVVTVIPLLVMLIVLIYVLKIIIDLVWRVRDLSVKNLLPFFPYIPLIYYLGWFVFEFANPEMWGFTQKGGSWTITFTSIGNISSRLATVMDKFFNEALVVIVLMIFVTGIIEILIYNEKLYKADRRRKKLMKKRDEST